MKKTSFWQNLMLHHVAHVNFHKQAFTFEAQQKKILGSLAIFLSRLILISLGS